MINSRCVKIHIYDKSINYDYLYDLFLNSKILLYVLFFIILLLKFLIFVNELYIIKYKLDIYEYEGNPPYVKKYSLKGKEIVVDQVVTYLRGSILKRVSNKRMHDPKYNYFAARLLRYLGFTLNMIILLFITCLVFINFIYC